MRLWQTVGLLSPYDLRKRKKRIICNLIVDICVEMGKNTQELDTDYYVVNAVDIDLPGALSYMAETVGLDMITEANGAVVAFKSASITDVQGITSASERIQQFLERNRPKRLIFDFEAVKFFSSQLLGLLLEARAKLKKYDGEAVVSAINLQLYRVFRITNLDKVFTFFPDKESALNAANTG